MKNSTRVFLVSTLLGIWPAKTTFARPEYAVRYGIVNCAACHTSPFGGGVRNTYGKQYGGHGLGSGPLSTQDFASFDWRAITLYPKKPSTTANGTALMTATPTANVPITKSGEKVTSRVVTAYGLGGLATGLRESYLLFDTTTGSDNSWISYVTFGKFVAPFGLLTEEHRTYTKLMTRTTENNFEMGGAVSGDPFLSFHYDLAVTNGLQSAGAFNSNDLPWAVIGNMRWNPPGMPFFVGASGEVHRTMTKSYNPYSDALYMALSLDRLSKNYLHGSIQAEAVYARGWNSNPPNDQLSYFIPTTQTAWLSSIVDAQAFGWYVLFNYDVTSRFALVYKLDEYMPDRHFSGDAFVRQGYGFRFFLNSNMNVLARYERSDAFRPGLTYTDGQAARDDVIAMLHVWL